MRELNLNRLKMVFAQKRGIFAAIHDKKQSQLVKSTLFFCLLLAVTTFSSSPTDTNQVNDRPEKLPETYASLEEQAWVDSVFQSMTFEERIGQLVMLRAHTDKGPEYEALVADQIAKYKPGGLCFFQGTPQRQAEITNHYQELSRVPMLIAIDGEWGLGMRLKESMSFPKQITLGAITETEPIFQLGAEIGRQCKRIGIHVNFAPVADINNNAANPVINDRSFGEDRENVTKKAIQYALGMQSVGVMACAKHFPGHGDTDVDSHEDLPVLHHSTVRLDSLELYPFKAMTKAGVGAMMVAHLNVPSIDNRKHRPATLSDRIIHRLLRRSIQFDGVIFTDAMEMKGVTRFFKPGEADVAAIKAGNDVVLLPENVDACFRALYAAVRSGELETEQVYGSTRRVLRAKYRSGLHQYAPVPLTGIAADLHSPQAYVLKRQLYRKALTLVRDEQHLVPVTKLAQQRFASLALGAEKETPFQSSLSLYADIQHFMAPKLLTPERMGSLLDSLKAFDQVIISLHDLSRKPANNFGITNESLQLIHELAERQQVVLVSFANPYALRNFDRIKTILQANDEDMHCQEVAAQALYGAATIPGRLPVTASASAIYGQGEVRVPSQFRMAYDLPESQGFDSQKLLGIDTLVKTMINTGASPGCQVLVAKNGTVIWNKAYGYHDYSQTTPVSTNDIYDLASVTKVAATTLATMHLDEQGMVNTAAPMSSYVPGLLNTDKSHLKVDEMLAHHAGLKSWIPFYKSTLDKQGRPDPMYYRSVADSQFSVFVAPYLYMNKSYIDSIWQQIYTSELRPVKAYKYSDLGLYLAKQMVENVSKKRLEDLTREQFYAGLGAYHTQFNPWLNGSKFTCVPSENDRYFRYCDIKGCVHDMGAAMLGGVSGHAGLFSNANDLAKVFQMLLNGGSYFGQSYLKPETIKKYTTRYPGCTRRGLGFDLKELNYQAQQNQGKYASDNTFGHLGFTGTCAWADPDNQLIIIVLANRTYPSMDNNKFITEDYRPRIQDVVYEAMRK